MQVFESREKRVTWFNDRMELSLHKIAIKSFALILSERAIILIEASSCVNE